MFVSREGVKYSLKNAKKGGEGVLKRKNYRYEFF